MWRISSVIVKPTLTFSQLNTWNGCSLRVPAELATARAIACCIHLQYTAWTGNGPAPKKRARSGQCYEISDYCISSLPLLNLLSYIAGTKKRGVFEPRNIRIENQARADVISLLKLDFFYKPACCITEKKIWYWGNTNYKELRFHSKISFSFLVSKINAQNENSVPNIQVSIGLRTWTLCRKYPPTYPPTSPTPKTPLQTTK